MQYIKLSKEQMYDLLKKYSVYSLPNVENTDFEKLHRRWAYCMRYSTVGKYMERKHVVAYIEFGLGQASLRVTCRKDGYDEIIHPALEDLEGMIYEDRRRAPWIIRYTKTDEMESFLGTDIEVMKHACEEGRRRGSRYIII